MSLTTGSTIGPYELVSELGSGGMATVYKAYHERLDRHVAVKLMHANFRTDAAFRARFEREARIVARLEHPHIVPVYDFNEHEGQPYIVMKFIAGRTLKDMLNAGPLSQGEMVRIMEAVADALAHAHAQGVLHRDIKPSNILIDENGRPFLTDFGLARLAASGESTMSADVMLGTPHYISPEQAKGETDLDTRTDVYSLGVVLYELVVGRVPFSGDTPYAIVHDHIYTPLPDPRTQNPNVTGAVAGVLEKALAKSPAERYASPLDLMADFKRALAGQQIAPARQAPPPDAMEAGPTGRRIPPPDQMPPPSVPPPPLQHYDIAIGDKARAADMKRQAMEQKRDHKIASGIPVNQDYFMWRPGTDWTQDIDGNYGFFTPAEIEAQYEMLPPEERIRKRAENKVKARQDMFQTFGIFSAVIVFLWVIYFITSFPGHPWPIWPMLAMGIAAFFTWNDYRQKHGAGREFRESAVQREIERERARLSGVYGADEKPKRKAKNDDDVNLTVDHRDRDESPPVRLTEDGEFTDSFIDELGDDEAGQRNRRG